MFDFNMFGHCMSFELKVLKHLEAKNPDRLKDYVCSAYDTYNPENYKNHPEKEIIQEAVDFLKSSGWRVLVKEWKDQGKQVICVSPDGGYYHSSFKH